MPGPPLTTDTYLRTPETLLPQELIYGLVRDAAAPTPGHQWVVGELFACLRAYLAQHGLGRVWTSPIDVVLDRERGLVVQPDVVVVLNSRLHLVTDRVWGAPDLAIEVLSPYPRIGNLNERIDWFAKYGVRECWLVHQLTCTLEVICFADGAIAQRKLYAQDEAIGSRVLPDLAVTPESMIGADRRPFPPRLTPR